MEKFIVCAVLACKVNNKKIGIRSCCSVVFFLGMIGMCEWVFAYCLGGSLFSLNAPFSMFEKFLNPPMQQTNYLTPEEKEQYYLFERILNTPLHCAGKKGARSFLAHSLFHP